MSGKIVIVLEDRPVLRNLLQEGLEARGFHVASAGTAGEAWQRVREVGEENVDVALLDAHLGDGEETGIQFGVELKKHLRDWPPEFLVFTAHDKPEYFQSALQLGAAAYLRKGEYGGDLSDPGAARTLRIDRIAEHLRALAVRRALEGERLGMATRIREIARASRSREQAMERFCQEWLAVELASVLEGQFVILLTDRKRATCFSSGGVSLPDTDILECIQSATHGRLGEDDPLVVNASNFASRLNDLPSEKREEGREVLRRLEGAAFIPLGETKAVRLSLGLLQESETKRPHDNVAALARVLGIYLRPAVITHLMEITDLWAEAAMERREADMKRQVLLKATRDSCLYLGQEMEQLLAAAEEGEEGGDSLRGSVRKLHVLAEELRDAGELLVHLGSDGQGGAKGQEAVIEMADLIRQIWATQLASRLNLSEPGFLQIEGRCKVESFRDQVELVVLQILGWLGRRVAREGGTALFVQCEPLGESGGVQVSFEERVSRRLPPQLRESLFSPFFSRPVLEPVEEIKDKGRRLGLYLAQALAESAGGALRDLSDELDGQRGHRFVLELPAREQAVGAES